MAVTRKLRKVEIVYDENTGLVSSLTIYQRKSLENPDIAQDFIIEDDFVRVTPADFQGSESNDLNDLSGNDFFPILNREDPIS